MISLRLGIFSSVIASKQADFFGYLEQLGRLPNQDNFIHSKLAYNDRKKKKFQLAFDDRKKKKPNYTDSFDPSKDGKQPLYLQYGEQYLVDLPDEEQHDNDK